MSLTQVATVGHVQCRRRSGWDEDRTDPDVFDCRDPTQRSFYAYIIRHGAIERMRNIADDIPVVKVSYLRDNPVGA
jgi:hypothetical protein